MSNDGDPVVIEQITYMKVARPPTVNQYLVNRYMRKVADENARIKGTTRLKGRPIPKSAKVIKDSMTGITAEDVDSMYPKWKDDYPAYVEEWKAKLKSTV